MLKIADTAQMVMDLYLQNYRSDEDFFRLIHFRYLCGVSYAKALIDEYKLSRQESMQEVGFTEITLSPDWLIKEVVTFEKKKDVEDTFIGKLKHPVFSFPRDVISNGIQTLQPVKFFECKEFIRESPRRKWMLCDLPKTKNIYWYYEGGEIVCVSKSCSLNKKEINVLYASDPSDESFGEDGGEITKAQEDFIIKNTLDMMFKARTGAVVDMSNNGNPNKRIQTEIDTIFPDDLRTKPVQ